MLEIPPQLGFYVEIVVFFLFAAIITPLILKPTQEVLAKRAEKTSGAQAEAENMRDEVALMADEFAKAFAEARRAGATGGEQIRREAEDAERKVLDLARTEARKTLDSIRAEISAETDQARQGLESQAAELAQVAARKILGREVQA
ncbi:MAG: ATP synthase F0 subunit B [Deltaproteobacteria bacterium]